MLKYVIEDHTEREGFAVKKFSFVAHVEGIKQIDSEVKGYGETPLDALIHLEVQLDFLYGDPEDQYIAGRA